MKKNFFKKLSFVMALAMIVSIIAPAAGAFAATSAHLNATKKYLHLGDATYGEYDFNIAHKQAGWKYAWTSSDEDVATVDAATGLTTATGVGSAKITVQITKGGEDVASLSATVVVRDNIKEISDIYMQTAGAPALDKLAVGTDYDFGRKFVTDAASTTETSSVTRWFLDSANATINDLGVFNATKAGTYKITAVAFQSKAKYDAWKALNDTTNLTGIPTKTIEVKVVPSITDIKQVDADSFAVTFDSDMTATDVKTASLVNKIVAGKAFSSGTEKIKAVTLDTTGKVATVDMYVPFTAATEYQFSYAGLTKNFTSAEQKLANIAGINFKDFDVTIPAAKDMLANVEAYDANGVVIYTGADLASYLTFEYKGDYAKGNIAGTNAYIYTEGYSAEIVAKLNAVVYDDTAKAYKTLAFTDSAIATGKKTDVNITTSSLQYAAPLASDATASDKLTYSATGVTVAAKDSNRLVVKYTTNDATSTAKYDAAATNFHFKSTDADKLLITGIYMYPINPGTVTVLVYANDDKTALGAFDVTIVAARAFGAAVPASTSVINVGNSDVDATGTTVKVALTDTLNQAIASGLIGTPTVTKVAGPTGTAPNISASVTGNGEVSVVAKGYQGSAPTSTAATVGLYSYKLTVGAYGTTKDVYFTVNVVDAAGSMAKAAYYQLELDKTSVDIKGVSSSAVSVNVYGYNTAGVKVYQVPTSDYTIAVKDASNNAPALTFTNTSIPVVITSGGAVLADATGAYVVTASTTNTSVTINGVTVATGASLAAGTLTVSDTTTKEFSVDSYAVAGADVLTAVKAAFGFKINGTDCENANGYTLASIEYTTGATGITSGSGLTSVSSGNSIYVASVSFTTDLGGGNLATYKIDVNRSITIK